MPMMVMMMMMMMVMMMMVMMMIIMMRRRRGRRKRRFGGSNITPLSELVVNNCLFCLTADVGDLHMWRHQMESFSSLLALFYGEFTDEFPSQSDAGFDVFFDLLVIWDAITLIMTSP